MAGVSQQRLDSIGARFDKGLDEIKELLRSFDNRVRALELREAGYSPLLTKRIVDAELQLLEQSKEIGELRKLISIQATTAQKLEKAVETITGWGTWGARIATALITSGLLFFIGRLIYFAIIGPS